MSILPLVVFHALAVALPQNPELQIPRPQNRSEPGMVQRPDSEVARFRRDLDGLRGSRPQVERTLQKINEQYPDLDGLIVQRLRAANARELADLMLVAQRAPSRRIADEILFQLQARPVGGATLVMVETLTGLLDRDARSALQDLVRGRVAAARRAATEVYARIATAEDLEFALELVDQDKLDLQISGIVLLGAVPDERARDRLCQLLSRDPTIGRAAVIELMKVGADAVPHLVQALGQPVADRGHAYAAFALVAEGLSPTSIPEAASQTLIAQLRGRDDLARSLAAVALADRKFRGQAPSIADAEIVDALMAVVVPGEFIPNMDILRRPAEMQLQRLTGRTGDETVGWAEWWSQARADFSGVREQVEVTAANAGTVVVSLQSGELHIRLLGESVADALPVRGALEYVLTAGHMQELCGRLQQAGLMDIRALAVSQGVPLERTMTLAVGDSRVQARGPAGPHEAFDTMADIVEQAADAELWQQLRHPVDEPDRAAYWRSEQRWRNAHTDRVERGRRLVHRALKVWPVAGPVSRDLFVAWLLGSQDRRQLVDEDSGLRIVELVAAADGYGERHQLLLELAATAPGDRVWRAAVDVAARRTALGEGVERIFAVLGVDRVLVALDDERPLVRRAAIDEVVRQKDLRAQAPVVALMKDETPEVRRAAIYAAGELRIPEAHRPIVELIVADETTPGDRRSALVALGKIGGVGAFEILQRAVTAPVQEDRDAALRGLGELRDARAAAELAGIFTASVGTTVGDLSRFYLQRMGRNLAVPALRGELSIGSPAIRTQVVLLLGSYQDPRIVGDLVQLLRSGYDRLVLETLIATTTGLRVDAVDDLASAVDRWWSRNRNLPQWSWLIEALDREGVVHSLSAEQFAAEAGLAPVPELARLMLECEAPRLRVLSFAVLCSVTGEEFGQVRPSTPAMELRDIAERYRLLYESRRTSQGR